MAESKAMYSKTLVFWSYAFRDLGLTQNCSFRKFLNRILFNCCVSSWTKLDDLNVGWPKENSMAKFNFEWKIVFL